MTKINDGFAGVVGVFKPVGPTSHDVVDAVRKITGERRVGHAGTLDPLAEGVLVVAVGREFTKKLSGFEGQEKEYVAEIKLGETSSTDDEEGEKRSFISPRHSELDSESIKERQKMSDQVLDDGIPSIDDVKLVANCFVGEIWQTPPLYSAVKVKGKEAYKYARKGKEVKLEPRKREVKEIEVLDYKWPMIRLRVVTGKGVYIRSLAWDIGERLGVGGYMKSLVRTKVGEFELDDCEAVGQLKEGGCREFTLLLPVKGMRVLLGMKKRGLGEGKWNGFGGKIERNESTTEAAKREFWEETGVHVAGIEKRGRLTFLGTGAEVVSSISV